MPASAPATAVARRRTPESPRRAGWKVVLSLVALSVSVACQRAAERAAAPSGAGANVFLVVMDAASAFHFGPWGAPPNVSPRIDALAGEWVVFDNAYSQATNTVVSTASLITGVRGTTHRMTSRAVLPRRYRTAAEILGEAGHRSFAFIGNPFAGAASLGYDRGYERAVQVYALPALRGKRAKEKHNNFTVSLPGDINEQVFAALDEFSHGGAFAYFHYLQPHQPYDPPAEILAAFLPEGRRPGQPGWMDWDQVNSAFVEANRSGETAPEFVEILRARYRANIHFVDAGIGALMDALRERKLYDDALIILTADHGDAFFKHGSFGHNRSLYDDVTRIPLMMKFPASDGIAPRRLPQLVETIDVLPTILDYLSVAAPAYLEGDSLWPLVRGEATSLPGPEVILASYRRSRHAIRVGDHKYIVGKDGREELYDLRRDPDEQHDLIASEADTARALRAKLESTVDLHTGRTLATANDLRADPEMRRLLETLGYVDTEVPAAEDVPDADGIGGG
jgi:arylsulfatase A-like enzyme